MASTNPHLATALRTTHEFMMSKVYQEHRLYHIVAPCVGIALGMVINFFVNNAWTYRVRKDLQRRP